MKIWSIKRDENAVEHDENIGHVIIAETEDRVRAVAAEASEDEGDAVWLTSFSSWVTCLGEADPKFTEGIIQTSFNAS